MSNPLINSNGTEWLYQCSNQFEYCNGYEDYLNTFNDYKGCRDTFEKLTEEQKNTIVDEIFNIYRKVNIFPINYYSSYGINKEIKRLYKTNVYYDGEKLNNRSNKGLNLCKFSHPIQFGIIPTRWKLSMFDKFLNDDFFKRVIKLSIKAKNDVAPISILSSMTLFGRTPTNFKPMSAQALIERYTPYNGTYFDFSQGLGGRLLGCLTSQKNIKYIGVDPWKETNICNDKLGKWVESSLGTYNSYKLYCMGSEVPFTNENIADFSFSSPPYMDLEIYCDDKTQCYNSFPTKDKWINNYMIPTIKNTYNILKPGAFYVVNIADYTLNNKEHSYTDIWKKIAIDIGFEYIKTAKMVILNRIGAGREVGSEGDTYKKSEPLFVFRKPLDMHNLANNVRVEVDY